MEQGLIELREQVMDRADAALAAAGPARLGDECIHETRRAAAELELIEAKMQANGFDRVEQSRTYRHLGGLYEDLEPALGKEMLLKAKNAYEAAEALLEGQSDDLERAKLNFNFGNTLRRIDTDNVEQLQEAMRRLLAARAYFAMNAPKYLTQADAALQSVKVLLSLAPLANAVNQNRDDMAALEKELAAGGNVNEIAAKAQAVMKRGGGVAATVGRLQTVVDTLPEDQRRNEKFPEIQKQVRDLAGRVLGGNEMTPDVKQVLSLLTDRLKSEAGTTVSKDRAETLKSRLEELGRVLSADEKDLPALREKGQRIQGLMEGMFDTLHYLSHGIERPPAGSRAARLVELNWQLRRYLLEETNRPEKGEEEGKEVLDLSVRASKADRRKRGTPSSGSRD
jgi:hypothetical protein